MKIGDIQEKKKVYLITDAYPFARGEATFIRPELEVLCKQFMITIICCSPNLGEITDKEFLEENDIQVISFYKEKLTYSFMGNIWKVLRHNVFVSECRNICRERKKIILRLKASFWFVYNALTFAEWMEGKGLIEEGSIYYTYWYYAHTLSMVLLKKKYPDLKIITRAHGYDIHDIEVKGERECCKVYMDSSMNGIVFIAEEGREYYLQHNRLISSERHKLYYLGSPAAEWVRENELCDNRKGGMVIVSCANMNKWKRIHLIIDALSLIDDYSVSWIHFGDGVLYEELVNCANEKLANKNNIEYKFAGYVDRKDIYQYYARNSCTCYVLLSALEGLPVSNMEALANGVPIITTDVGGCSETIDHNGVLLSASPTATEVKIALDKIMSASEQEYINMRVNSLRLWREKFNVDNNMKKFAKYLQTI